MGWRGHVVQEGEARVSALLFTDHALESRAFWAFANLELGQLVHRLQDIRREP
jgi:hypothetical protein